MHIVSFCADAAAESKPNTDRNEIGRHKKVTLENEKRRICENLKRFSTLVSTVWHCTSYPAALLGKTLNRKFAIIICAFPTPHPQKKPNNSCQNDKCRFKQNTLTSSYVGTGWRQCSLSSFLLVLAIAISGCGSDVGSAFASDTRDLQFESSHRPYLFTVN